MRWSWLNPPFALSERITIKDGAVQQSNFYDYYVPRINEISEIDVKVVPTDDMNIPGFRLHPLRGNLAGFWAVSVSGNWRVTFRFDNGHAADPDYMDYH